MKNFSFKKHVNIILTLPYVRLEQKGLGQMKKFNFLIVLVAVIFPMDFAFSDGEKSHETSFQKKTREMLQKREKHKQRSSDLKQWAELTETIAYDGRNANGQSYYDLDDVNFIEDSISSFEGITKDWVVLVNIHSNMPLNLTNRYQPKMRTLSWVTPFWFAKNHFSRLGYAHDKLALPKDWSKSQYRKQISFILVPPQTELSFKYGFAKEQKGYLDERLGTGLQMRLKYLPKGSVVLTGPLLQESQIHLSKEEKRVDIRKNFVTLQQEYIVNHSESDIPEDLPSRLDCSDFQSMEEFIDSYFDSPRAGS